MTDTVTLHVAGAAVTIPAKTLTDLWLERVRAASAPTPAFVEPVIGKAFAGGLYAGLTVYENAPRRLILLPGEFCGDWKAATAWATDQGGELPSRIDYLVLWASLKAEFREAWYWCAESYAPDAASAWAQGFGNGGQVSYRKDLEFRARAVRRLPL